MSTQATRSTQTTLDLLDEIIDRESYSRHSFISALTAGKVSRDRMRDWAVQKYHQTYGQNRGFSAIHANTRYADVRRYEMMQLIAEETDLADGTDAHYNLMRRFAEVLGAGPEMFDKEPATPVADFLDYLLRTCRENHFVWGLLAFYVNERQTPAAVEKMRVFLTSSWHISDVDVEWFTVHSQLDGGHALGARLLIEKYAHEVPEFDAEAPQFVRRGCAQWLKLQDFYYSVVRP
ncbi:TenA family transcriptional regulator [Frankia sp. CiP3]|uniref:TenA family transcriptional regulator n=1 Tax=Frankia sp. CiP3 TaxID=2880971 RepID=UPI001EF6C149|nr:iron-containing redox enzyme family protein [Frankia sp. CiP3]